MKISGFSFTRNADTLYYPIVESIRSILPICDEFVIAVGRGNTGDRTREMIERIADPKIRILDTEWPDQRDSSSLHVFARQTNLALEHCTGDWCFYLQTDEVVHEQDIQRIKGACHKYLADHDVEGFLFRYRHFWGDYDHRIVSHGWYPLEIRLVRNGRGVTSYRDAQSFRIDRRKMRVRLLDAWIYHYGWVRPPGLMQAKKKEFSSAYVGKAQAEQCYASLPRDFDYGSLEKIPRFRGVHPCVMKEWMAGFDWADQLQYSGRSKVKFGHDRPRNLVLTFLEQRVLGGRQIGGFRNYRCLGKA